MERYDEKLMYYKTLMSKMNMSVTTFEINCVELRLGNLLTGIRTHAKEWLVIFGGLLQDLAKRRLNSISTYITVCYCCSVTLAVFYRSFT